MAGLQSYLRVLYLVRSCKAKCVKSTGTIAKLDQIFLLWESRPGILAVRPWLSTASAMPCHATTELLNTYVCTYTRTVLRELGWESKKEWKSSVNRTPDKFKLDSLALKWNEFTIIVIFPSAEYCAPVFFPTYLPLELLSDAFPMLPSCRYFFIHPS